MSTEEFTPEVIALREQWKDATDDEVLGAYDNDEVLDAKTMARAVRLARKREDAAEGDVRYPLGSRYRKKPGSDINVIDIKFIQISPARRPLDEARVSHIMESIRKVGLLQPPIVVYRDGIIIDDEPEDHIPVLVAGHHRIEAWRRLGHSNIPCIAIENVSDLEAELMEIAENLHRAELTALQRDEQIARWIELTAAKRESQITPAPVVSAQVAPKSIGRPESGINAASRELGIERTDAQRAVKVAGLSDEAKQAAADAGLDNNRSALLAAAKEKGPEKQVAAITARAATPACGPELAARLKARDEREKTELAAFMAQVEAVAPLMAEIKCGDEVCAYNDLTYLQIAERYKPIIALRAYRWRVGYGKAAGDASRRIEQARDMVISILTGTAEDELEKAAADTQSAPADAPATDSFDGAPIPRTPEVDLDNTPQDRP